MFHVRAKSVRAAVTQTPSASEKQFNIKWNGRLIFREYKLHNNIPLMVLMHRTAVLKLCLSRVVHRSVVIGSASFVWPPIQTPHTQEISVSCDSRFHTRPFAVNQLLLNIHQCPEAHLQIWWHSHLYPPAVVRDHLSRLVSRRLPANRGSHMVSQSKLLRCRSSYFQMGELQASVRNYVFDHFESFPKQFSLVSPHKFGSIATTFYR